MPETTKFVNTNNAESSEKVDRRSQLEERLTLVCIMQ